MINLSDDILRNFTTSLRQDKVSSDVTMFGEVMDIISPQEVAVLLDGSTEQTIARVATVCQEHDKVSVLIRDHKAIVTGNLTNPASSSSDSSFVRVYPDGSIVIGRLDNQGNPVGYYVKATDDEYTIQDAISREEVFSVSTSGGKVNGKDILSAENLIDYIYPVGAIYLSVNSTNPETIFGGTWELLSGGYVLKSITAGTGGTTNAAGNTGSTTLTAAQSGLKEHTHEISQAEYDIKINNRDAKLLIADKATGVSGWMLGNSTSGMDLAISRTADATVFTSTNADATQGHTHTAGIPQNIGVYVWKRTA